MEAAAGMLMSSAALHGSATLKFLLISVHTSAALHGKAYQISLHEVIVALPLKDSPKVHFWARRKQKDHDLQEGKLCFVMQTLVDKAMVSTLPDNVGHPASLK